MSENDSIPKQIDNIGIRIYNTENHLSLPTERKFTNQNQSINHANSEQQSDWLKQYSCHQIQRNYKQIKLKDIFDKLIFFLPLPYFS